MSHALKAGFLLTACMLVMPVDARAGFEFVPTTRAPAQAAAPAMDAPMPVAQAPEVIAEPLAPADPVLSRTVSQPMQETYVRRQGRTIPLKAPANEPYDSAGLLAATTQAAPVSVAPQSPYTNMHRPAAAPSMDNERLVINPYPLRDRGVSQADTYGMDAVTTQDAHILSVPAGLSPMPASAGVMAPLPSAAPAPIQISNTPRAPQPGPAPLMPPQQQAAPVQPQTQSGFADAVGFGRDLPLPLALSQIVPPGYSYAFAQNIDAGVNVSWQGGKPWNAVLDEMLAPSGMRAVIQGNQVTIVKAA
ncbi:MAG: hypothetical protein DI626_01795 [Micavibrio aeruginosavorus]|uniref:Uncharacterized protein n=1 Tax=Micavibrio aeruginosavorus TaxID=349221 RepID=A0A2W5A1L2_9BACT|nr:MAG: hypothetical protein DI626_01795 [Micavibrio aeruginosavorus]